MSRARVLVATDHIAELSSVAAGAALAHGLAEFAEVAVVPMATGGRQLAEAIAAISARPVHREAAGWWIDLGDTVVIGGPEQSAPDPAVVPRDPADPAASTAGFGRWVRQVAQEHSATSVVLDLTGIAGLDGGAGLLAEAASVLAGRSILGVVATDELDLAATGLQGVVARRGYGAGWAVGDVLAADAAMRAHADALGTGLATVPGGGAAGGTGLAVVSLGGRLLSGPQYCHFLAGLERTLAAADLVVTGCTELSALDRGGVVVSAVAQWAEEALTPCVAVAGGQELSRREVRTFGLEAMHAIASPVDAAALAAVARRLAGSWFSLR